VKKYGKVFTFNLVEAA